MTDVLVVGAGPVGLVAALELTRRGLVVRIVEQRTTASAESRALGINPRTLDILDPAGVTPPILHEGIRINRARLVSRGKSIGTIKFSAVDHRYPFMTALPQARTEVLLEEALLARGIVVERGVRFEDNVGNNDAPIARLVSAAGEELVGCSYLLGCDGPHSRVRAAAGIDFEGSAFEHKWSLMDAAIDWPFPPDEACFMFTDRGNLFVLPVSPGVWRLVVPGEDLRSALPDWLEIRQVVWESRFRVAHRLASSFQAGNVFLAGDSAHVHSPAGARGMNGGIEDAACFAYLLARNALAGYAASRRRAAEHVLRQVEMQTRQAQSRNVLLLGLREFLGGILLPLPIVQKYAASFVTAQDSPRPIWLDRN